MAERKLRFDSAHTVVVSRPLVGASAAAIDGTVTTTDPGPVENTETTRGSASIDLTCVEFRRDERTVSEHDLLPELERAVQEKLNSQPAVSFSSLGVHRIAGGICLKGVLETNARPPDIEGLVRSVADVDRILNCLVIKQIHDPEN